MIVRELVALLNEKDPDSKVVRADNSGGYEDIFELFEDEVTIIFRENRGQTENVVVLE